MRGQCPHPSSACISLSEIFQFADVEAGRLLGRRGHELRRVPAAHGHRVRLHAAQRVGRSALNSSMACRGSDGTSLVGLQAVADRNRRGRDQHASAGAQHVPEIAFYMCRLTSMCVNSAGPNCERRTRCSIIFTFTRFSIFAVPPILKAGSNAYISSDFKGPSFLNARANIGLSFWSSKSKSSLSFERKKAEIAESDFLASKVGSTVVMEEINGLIIIVKPVAFPQTKSFPKALRAITVYLSRLNKLLPSSQAARAGSNSSGSVLHMIPFAYPDQPTSDQKSNIA